MAQVRFTSALTAFIPGLRPMEVAGETVREVMDALASQFPHLDRYVLDERGALRKHVNIFVNNSLIHDRTGLSDRVSQKDEIFVIQALSGG